MFKCLGWPCPAAFIFCFWRNQWWFFGLLALRNTWCGNTCFGAQVSSKCGIGYSERVSLQFMCVCYWAGRYIFSLHTADESQKDGTAVLCCDPVLSVLVMSIVSKRLSRSIIDSTLAAFIICGPLQFPFSHINYKFWEKNSQAVKERENKSYVSQNAIMHGKHTTTM